MSRDLVSVIEAAYAVEKDEAAWLEHVLAAVRPLLDRGRGCSAFLYDASDAHRFRVWSFIGSSGRSDEAILRAIGGTTPDRVEWVFRTQVCRMASEGPDWANQPAARLFKSFGIDDLLFVNGLDPGGIGCFVTATLPVGDQVPPGTTRRWARVAAHLAAGYRLQRRLARAAPLEAILSPTGRLEHVEGAAATSAARAALQDAVRAIERARGGLRKSDPDDAVERWPALVRARWTMVDEFESDGRRYVVARSNEPEVPVVERLTPRERQVLAYAALGHSNKLIAYELGISASTVGVLLSRAGKRLGTSSRAELLAAFRRVSS